MHTYTLPPFVHESFEVYRSRRAQFITSHQLGDFLFCPLYHRKKLSGLIPETIGEHYLLGSATHCLTLEGRHEFERQYIVGGPINPKTERPYGRDTKAYAEWEAEQGKPCLSDEQYALCCQIAAAVKGHTEARDILSEGVAEGVLRAEYCCHPCQIRADWFSPWHGLVDLKTCQNIDDFEADCETYNYVGQMAFYRSIIEIVTAQRVPVTVIAAEKREPFRVGVWDIDAADLDAAAAANYQAIDELSICVLHDTWPTRFESRRLLKRDSSKRKAA